MLPEVAGFVLAALGSDSEYDGELVFAPCQFPNGYGYLITGMKSHIEIKDGLGRNYRARQVFPWLTEFQDGFVGLNKPHRHVWARTLQESLSLNHA